MRLRSLSGLCVGSVLAASVVAVACGSTPDKKKTPQYDSGGQAGEGGAPTPTAAAGNTSSHGGEATAQGGDSARGGTTTTQGGETSGANGGAAGVTAIAEGGAGGAAVSELHGLYVGKGGLDTADGTVDAPFETLAHAASVAQAGDTIVFLDGAYSVGVAATIPDGVDLMAQNSGAATLTASSGSLDLLELSGSTRVRGLKFSGYSRVASYPAGTAATGTLTIEDSTFTNCTTTCLDLTGDVQANVTAAADAVVGNAGNAFALLSGAAKLTVNGGILENYAAAGVIRATGDASVSLSDVQFLGGTGWALVSDEKAQTLMDGVTIATQSQGLINVKGESSITVTNSDLSMQPAAASVYNCFYIEADGVGSVTVEDSHLHECNVGFKGTIPGSLIVTRTQVDTMPWGADLGGGSTSPGGVVRITDSEFSATQYTAFRVGAGPEIVDLKLRGSSFSGASTGVTWNTIYLNGNGASVIDLGTGADPGGNTFLSASASYPALWIGNGFAALTTYAVGNTWTPLAQGADAAGHYAASTTPGVLDSTSTVAGQNYSKTYGGTIRLAENL